MACCSLRDPSDPFGGQVDQAGTAFEVVAAAARDPCRHRLCAVAREVCKPLFVGLSEAEARSEIEVGRQRPAALMHEGTPVLVVPVGAGEESIEQQIASEDVSRGLQGSKGTGRWSDALECLPHRVQGVANRFPLLVTVVGRVECLSQLVAVVELLGSTVALRVDEEEAADDACLPGTDGQLDRRSR